MEEILFIGGDKRILYAAELISQSTQVHSLGLASSPEGLPRRWRNCAPPTGWSLWTTTPARSSR